MNVATKRESSNDDPKFTRDKGSILRNFLLNDMYDRNASRLQPLEMSKKQKDSLTRHYRSILLEQKPDVFHKTMLLCIQSSPKMNEIIACQMYCFRDLTKWPKLNQICQRQQEFYTRQIEEHRLDGLAVAEEAFKLGKVHYNYAKYGLKPHFLDLFTLHFETFLHMKRRALLRCGRAIKKKERSPLKGLQVLQRLKFPSDEEKHTFIMAFRQLNVFITSTINAAYSQCQQQAFQARR